MLQDLRDNGIGIYSTGGETADVGDLVRTLIVDSTVTCRMKREDVVTNEKFKGGQVIVGMASFGQASSHNPQKIQRSILISYVSAYFSSR